MLKTTLLLCSFYIISTKLFVVNFQFSTILVFLVDFYRLSSFLIHFVVHPLCWTMNMTRIFHSSVAVEGSRLSSKSHFKCMPANSSILVSGSCHSDEIFSLAKKILKLRCIESVTAPSIPHETSTPTTFLKTNSYKNKIEILANFEYLSFATVPG